MRSRKECFSTSVQAHRGVHCGSLFMLELAYARPIANAMLVQPEFLGWFLSGTKVQADALTSKPLGQTQACLRSAGLKNPYWFNYWCPKDGRCACRVESGIETDILIVYACTNNRRLAVHVEVKRPHDSFRPGQAESYPRRAACWVNAVTRPRTVPAHHDFVTLLVCDRELKADPRSNNFDKVICHDELRDRIELYPYCE